MIVAITGKKHSGKNTVADMLSEALGWPVVSFAHKLKKMTCALTGCTMEQLEDYAFKESTLVPTYLWPFCNSDTPPTYRSFLQGMGTDIMRTIYPNIWIEATLNEAPDDVIVSDCRFPNEQGYVESYNGIVVKVLRCGISSNDSHASEVEMESIVPDVTIVNDGSLEELRDKVNELAKDIVSCTVKAEY